MPGKPTMHRTAFGVTDTTGVNPYLPNSGWDVLFGPDVFASNLPDLEVFHVALDGPIGSSAAVLLDNQPWDYVNQGWANGWDPSQPLPLWPGATLAFCWNVAATAPPFNRTTNIRPTVTVWLRYPPPAAPAQTILPGLAFPAGGV
jgi:hypothetical protein